MTIDLIKPHELAALYLMMCEIPEIHNPDPTFRNFIERLNSDKILVHAVRTGKKFIGAVGFQESTWMFKGIHFIPEVRGSGVAAKAVIAMLCLYDAEPVRAQYFISNSRVARFLYKLGAKPVDGGAEGMQMVEFDSTEPLVRLA